MNKFYFWEVSSDLVDFLKGQGQHSNRDKNLVDKQIYSHFGEPKKHSDKYIGIIIEWQNQKFFAPLTHDGERKWFNRQESCDFEPIYNSYDKYVGSILLCKALPLTNNLVKQLSIKEIMDKEGVGYGKLCLDELNYLNSSSIHTKIQQKMIQCRYNYQSLYEEFRVNYDLVIKNVLEYNKLKQQEIQINQHK